MPILPRTASVAVDDGRRWHIALAATVPGWFRLAVALDDGALRFEDRGDLDRSVCVPRASRSFWRHRRTEWRLIATDNPGPERTLIIAVGIRYTPRLH